MKTCPGCNTSKPDNAFGKHKRRPDGLQTVCKVCKKTMDANYYASNREAQLARNRENLRRRRDEVVAYKQSKGCLYCPENDPCCLDFHHTDDNKEFSLGGALSKVSHSTFWNEVAKCVVICANCHRKLHAGRLGVVAQLAEHPALNRKVGGSKPPGLTEEQKLLVI